MVVLAGGVGAARFLRGLVRAVPPERVAAVVNTGDDRDFYGVHVAPDLDIVTYTLAERVDPARGYGLAGDSFAVVDALGALGHETWFRLGDRDFATALHRTTRLRDGAGLAAVTDEIRRAFGVGVRLLPMTEDPAPTYVELGPRGRVHFQEYLARDGAPEGVTGVDLSAAARARPGPGVRAILEDATAILLAPSNPVVSIGPILAVPGLQEAVAASDAPTVAVSPIVGGAPVKGPADRLLRGTGREVSARGVAAIYRELCDGFVMDVADAAQEEAVAALGLRPLVCETLMRDAESARGLAERALELAGAIAQERA